MSITNHQQWRVLVTSVSVSFDVYQPLGILNTHYLLKRDYGADRAVKILTLIGTNLRDHEDIMSREQILTRRMQSPALRRAITRNRRRLEGLRVQLKSKRIRKQDDAPQAGADSSAKKCIKCESEFHCEGEICESCSVTELWGC